MAADTRELLELKPWRIVLAGLCEPMVRAGGVLGLLLGKCPEGIELVLRGVLLGGRAGWRVGRNVRFVGPAGHFRFGRGVTLYGNAYINAYGESGAVKIGAHSHVDQFCVLYGQGGLEIGRDCAVASGVIVYTQSNQDHLKDGTPVCRQAVRYARVVIADGCLLGAGCRLLPGVELGCNVHVGSGAVVISSIESGQVVVGVPARPVKRSEL
jgi:acetyltransferase-like isoleucine patch superfamily enzyme